MIIFDFAAFMTKQISATTLLLLGFIFFLYGLTNAQTDPNKLPITRAEQGDLEKLYKELKIQKPDKDIEIHYLKETIIKEPTERDEYLKHLLEELHKSLQKGKKWGTVRRVEGRLVEIDKGAVHKIRERDVYIVQDASGKYKSKMEVEAIADAVSIGTSYEKNMEIAPGDMVKFRGQRKLLELGLIYGLSGSEEGASYSGLGMLWEYNLRGGWGFESVLTYLARVREYDIWATGIGTDYYTQKVAIPVSFGARKYYYYPYWISPFVGLGGSYLKINYSHAFWGNTTPQTHTEAKMSTVRLIPYFVIGTQLSGNQFHFNLEARYFHGPELKFEQEKIKFRPTIYCASVSFTW